MNANEDKFILYHGIGCEAFKALYQVFIGEYKVHSGTKKGGCLLCLKNKKTVLAMLLHFYTDMCRGILGSPVGLATLYIHLNSYDKTS